MLKKLDYLWDSVALYCGTPEFFPDFSGCNTNYLCVCNAFPIILSVLQRTILRVFKVQGQKILTIQLSSDNHILPSDSSEKIR